MATFLVRETGGRFYKCVYDAKANRMFCVLLCQPEGARAVLGAFQISSVPIFFERVNLQSVKDAE